MFNFFKLNFMKTAFTALLVVFVTSCASGSKWTSLSVAERLLSFPLGDYKHVVYIDNKVIGFADDIISNKEQAGFAYEGDEKFTPFNPGQDSKCVRSLDFQVVSILPDGRLGLLKECNDESAATIYLSKNRSIYAYDWQTKELEQLVAGKLTQGSHPKFYTWNPEMTLGIQETTGSYRGTIYWIASDGMSPMDIEIESRELTWNLKDYLEGKERTGMVVAPSWSPDSKTIAFFVSTYGIREEPKPKFNVNYDLFFMDPSTLKSVPELMDVADADNIVWSPDNEYLLFRGCIGRRLTCGLWRYRINDRTLSLIEDGESFADYIWITNNKVVAIKDMDIFSDGSEIWEYSISE